MTFGIVALLIGIAHAEENHLVRPGETVASIAEARGQAGHVREIYRFNGITPRDELIPGTILKIPSDAALPEHAAHVASLSGSGRIFLPTGEQQPLTMGANLHPGTLICTDSGSTARIRLAREADDFAHDEVSLMAETCLRIEQLVSRKDSRSSTLSLEQGSVSVRESSGSGEIILRSEDGVLIGEEGGFRVTLEDEATRTEALRGGVALLGAGVEVQLEVNEGSRVRAGEAPDAPTKLLPGARLMKPGDGTELYLPRFAWAEVPEALGYRIELARDPEFADILMAEDIPYAEWTPEMLFLPFRVPGVWWRVSTFDRIGFLGGSEEVWQIDFPAGVGP